MKKLTILACVITMTVNLNAQEMKMVTHFKDGNVMEAPIAAIDSVTFSEQEQTPVIFTISNATDITYNSATFNASVTTTATVTDKGICYSQNPEPTTADAKVSKGAGTGNFSATLTGLTQNTHYYARPYAIANGKTCYGEMENFQTLQDYDGVVINGIRWATRNVGAHGQFVEKPEHFGGYYQWGRRGDGHEQPTSGTTSTLSDTDTPPHGDFIVPPYSPIPKYDWRSPQNHALWGPIKTANDPCPAGWRVPTSGELESLAASDSYEGKLNGIDGRFFGSNENTIFFPAAGYRSSSNGLFYNVGGWGVYWSCTPNSTYTNYLFFNSSYVNVGYFTITNYGRASGSCVRCVSDQ